MRGVLHVHTQAFKNDNFELKLMIFEKKIIIEIMLDGYSRKKLNIFQHKKDYNMIGLIWYNMSYKTQFSMKQVIMERLCLVL